MTYFCLPGFRHFAPSLVEFVVGLSMSSASSPIYVRYVGHIHVYWLDAFAGSANLLAGFDPRGRPCDVRYLGRRGGVILQKALGPGTVGLTNIIPPQSLTFHTFFSSPMSTNSKKWGKHRDMHALSINDAQFKLYLLDD